MTENENAAEQIAENTPTQTLFRFVSLRSPQLSDDKGLNKRFILIPESLKDDLVFYKPVTMGTGSKRKLLQTSAASFKNNLNCFTQINDLKINFSLLYNFSTWLARNKNTCSYAEFLAQRDAVFASHNYIIPDVNNLWNNLIYQVVTQKDFYIKEIVMQMLLALHTLQTVASTEDEVSILLNARVVLPKELMVEDETLPVSPSAAKLGANYPKQTFPSEEMIKQQRISSSNLKLKKSDALKKNLAAAEKQYQKEYQAAYKIQEEAYQRTIAPIITEYNEAVALAKEEYCGIREPGVKYDPLDLCHQPKEVPYPVLPKFEFTFRDEISADYLISSLKPENLETLLGLLGYDFIEESVNKRSAENDLANLDALLEGRNRFAEITSLINESVEKNNNIIVENTEGNNETYTSIGGVILPFARGGALPFTFQICPKSVYRYFNLDLSLNVPDSTWDVAGILYTLTSSAGVNNTDGYFVKSRVGNTIFLNDLFQSGVEHTFLENASIEVKITFTNGRVAHFNLSDIHTKTCISSGFELESIEEPGEPPVVIIDEEKDFIPSGFGFKQIGIADYLKVEQSTHAYVEGEVAHIENVMAREYREKSTRRLRRSENTTTSSSDTEREQINDTTTANRFEMQTEISKMMQEAKDAAVFANAHLGFRSNYTLDLGANYAHHQSKEESTRQAMTQAQDVTSRAMDRIVNKVHEERIEKIIEEFEENNSHGLDNRKGDKHVVGVYRWVDKLMKNQIYNYGKRMMFEFMIPEPAKLHVLGMKNVKTADQTNLVKPEDPRTPGSMQITDYSVLTDVKLKYWVGKYNVELDEKLEDIISIGKSFDFFSQPQDNGTSKSADVSIPDHYETYHAAVSFNGMAAVGAWDPRVLVAVGNKSFISHPSRIDEPASKAIDHYKGNIPVTFAVTGFHTANASLNIKCKTTLTYKEDWNKKAFKAIIDAYEEALVDYNNKLSEEQNKAVVIKDSNPNFYRQIESTVLRKNCISYMADRTVDSTHGFGLSGLTQGNSFTDHETTLSAKLDQYTAFVKFMEQAFEWENLSYYLYSYYWGNRQNWVELYQAENTDPLFRSFLQSGMARVIVTVRPGFENAVQFYLATGKIWNGGELPVIGDELYLSIVDEMKEPKGIKQGKAWLTRLPTTLNILQAESIGLKVAHALPFTTENPDDFEVPSEVITEDRFNFEKNENLLGVLSGIMNS